MSDLYVWLAPGAALTSSGGGGQASSPEISFATLAVVIGVALLAPLLCDLKPSWRIPSAVVEIVLGIVVGPSGFGWIRIDQPVSILSVLGLALLLFLAGLEIDARALRRQLGRLMVGYAASVALAMLVALVIAQVEDIDAPLFVAFALASSTVGLIVPILRDAGETETSFGQAVLAGTSFGEFGAILLLSLFFSASGHSSSTGSRLFLLALFVMFAVMFGVALVGLERSRRVSSTLRRLERTSAQLGIRFAVALLIAFAALASALGLATILGVFIAGLLLRMVDPAERLVHPEFRLKIEGIGYGFLVPVFFVASGLQLDFRGMFAHPRHVLLVAAFVVGLLIARGLPALLYRRRLGASRTVALGLLQATSLTVLVIAASLGHQLHVFDDPTDAAMVVAGLVSVIVFPPVGLRVLGASQAALAGQGVADGLDELVAARVVPRA